MAEPWEYIHTKRVLNKYGLPVGAFDPEAPGKQTYDIYWMNIRTKRGTPSRSHEPEATLRISARHEGKNRHLGITCSDLKFYNTTEINAQCENNALTSPKACRYCRRYRFILRGDNRRSYHSVMAYVRRGLVSSQPTPLFRAGLVVLALVLVVVVTDRGCWSVTPRYSSCMG